MKRWFKIIMLLTIMSIVAHNLVPHTHHFKNIQLVTCTNLPTEVESSEVADTCTHNHQSASCCFLVYLSVPIYNYVSDFQLMSDSFLSLFYLMIILYACCCTIYKIKWKVCFLYFLNYKSPFVGSLNSLRAPPFFSFA